MKLVAINELGKRIGETHGRAKLTDHDVELILSLLDCRAMLLAEYQKVGLTKREIEKSLHTAQLSYAGIAAKFEVSKSQIRWIAIGSQRGQHAARWKSERGEPTGLIGGAAAYGPGRSISTAPTPGWFVCRTCNRSHKDDAKAGGPKGNLFECVHCAKPKRRAPRVNKGYFSWNPPE